LRLHRSAVVGRIVLGRENYHRAILDFYNNIGTKRTFYACRRMSVLGGKAVMQRTTAKTDFDPNGLREHHATCQSRP
jgi:hypothetical protein